MADDAIYWQAVEARLRALAPELSVLDKRHDEDTAHYILNVQHTRTRKTTTIELPEDPVWEMVDNQDKREEAKVDKAILEAKSAIED